MDDFKAINEKIGRIGTPIILVFLASMLAYGFYSWYQIRHYFYFYNRDGDKNYRANKFQLPDSVKFYDSVISCK